MGKLQDPVCLRGHVMAVTSVLSQKSSLFLPTFSLSHSSTHTIWKKVSLGSDDLPFEERSILTKMLSIVVEPLVLLQNFPGWSL